MIEQLVETSTIETTAAMTREERGGKPGRAMVRTYPSLREPSPLGCDAWMSSKPTSAVSPRSTTDGSLGTYDRDALARGLLSGGVAGTATHPLDNVRGNILMLTEGDPDKLFGLSGLPGDYDLDEILSMVEVGAGAAIDHDERFGPVDIRPGPVLDVCAAWGERLHAATQRNETVVLATGHPTGLALLYHRLDSWLVEHGARVLAPGQGVRWRQEPMPHDWFIDHGGASACSPTVASLGTPTGPMRCSACSTRSSPIW